MAPTPSPSPLLLLLLKLAQGVEGGGGRREEVGGGGGREREKKLTSSSSPFSGWDLKGTTQFSAALSAKRQFTLKPRSSLFFEKFTGSEEPQEDLRFPCRLFLTSVCTEQLIRACAKRNS